MPSGSVALAAAAVPGASAGPPVELRAPSSASEAAASDWSVPEAAATFELLLESAALPLPLPWRVADLLQPCSLAIVVSSGLVWCERRVDGVRRR
jgi:hypothetical protein